MKSAATTPWLCQGRKYAWVTITTIALLASSGCSKAPEAPTAAQEQQSLDIQIQSIQNSPTMSASAKQQAIAGIKAQQGKTVTKP